MLVPTPCGDTLCDPLAPFAPVQSFSAGDADAEQESAFVLDQLSFTEFPNMTELGDVVSVAVGASGGALVPPQPCKSSAAMIIREISLRRDDFMAASSGKKSPRLPGQANVEATRSDCAHDGAERHREQNHD